MCDGVYAVRIIAMHLETFLISAASVDDADAASTGGRCLKGSRRRGMPVYTIHGARWSCATIVTGRCSNVHACARTQNVAQKLAVKQQWILHLC